VVTSHTTRVKLKIMNMLPTERFCTFCMEHLKNSDCCSVWHELTGCNTNLYVSTTLFITQGNYVGYMFRLINSHGIPMCAQHPVT